MDGTSKPILVIGTTIVSSTPVTCAKCGRQAMLFSTKNGQTVHVGCDQ
jgi:hypothetical protein